MTPANSGWRALRTPLWEVVQPTIGLHVLEEPMQKCGSQECVRAGGTFPLWQVEEQTSKAWNCAIPFSGLPMALQYVKF
jgi:hypothetical protein